MAMLVITRGYIYIYNIAYINQEQIPPVIARSLHDWAYIPPGLYVWVFDLRGRHEQRHTFGCLAVEWILLVNHQIH